MESLKTILYFSIFNHPLKLEEICDFSISKEKANIEIELNELIAKKIIYKIDEFYSINNNSESLEKRKKGNLMAVEALIKAKSVAKFIAKFPFVEAVGVSGSLSKGYYDMDSDIDFFVITKPNKVWISRTFLMLYKKIFLLNSRKFFCINYFISSGNLEIEEKNRFTATEIKTLIPLQGKTAFEKFYKKNNWVSEIFGEFIPKMESIENINKPSTSIITERVLDNKLGCFFDDSFKKITVLFWKLKFKNMNKEDFKIALKSTKNISKHHPLNFQKKVITALNEKYDTIKKNHDIVLTKEHV